MKILKNARQNNLFINTDMYNKRELDAMVQHKLIFQFDECYDTLDRYNDLYPCRIWCDDLDRITVEYNEEYGFYTTVAYTTTGIKIYVELN